jgi:hypothetical protein
MKTPNQNSSQKASKKSVKLKTRCNKCKKMPSEQNCSKCISNMFEKYSKDSLEDENLSSDEKVTKFQKDLDNLVLIPALIFQVYQTILEKKIQIENEKQKLAIAEKIKSDDSLLLAEKMQKTVRKKIPIIGKKSEIGRKIGKFFFNPENKDGLHLPKIHETTIIELFCDNCESIDNTEFSVRYLQDNVTAGANEDLEEEN